MRPNAKLDDASIERAVQSSGPARDHVLQCLRPWVRSRLRAALRGRPDLLGMIDDLIQEVLSGVNRGLPLLRVRTVAGLRAFTQKHVDRRVSDQARRARRTDQERAGFDGQSREAVVRLWRTLSGSAGSPPSSWLRRKEAASRLHRLMRALPPNHRAILELCFWEDLDTAAAANRLEITRNAASMRLMRAIGALRSAWNALESNGDRS